MMIVAAWCAGVAVLAWLNQERQAWVPWLSVLPMALLAPGRWALVLTAALSAALYLTARTQKGPQDREVRAALARFWQQTSVLLTAGMTFWRAVETASEAEPVIAPAMAEAARRIQQRPNGPLDPRWFPGEDGELTLLLLQHGYLHGISSQQIQSQVRHYETRLTYEREAKKQRDPLWLTILPAMLLLNVLWLFLAPMVSLAGHSWLGL